MDWIVFVILVVIAAASGAVFKPGDWYESLNKPGWTPPDWVFPVVWTVLYVLIAWAGIRVWRAGPDWIALGFWGLQWVFNTAWSWLFFGRRRMDLALLDVIALWLSVAAFIVVASSTDGLAAAFFAPYLLWVSIAAMLNLSVLRANPRMKEGGVKEGHP